jgi:hypothetical protein
LGFDVLRFFSWLNAEPIPQKRAPHFGAGLEHFRRKVCAVFRQENA